ncbi:GNAT family N-acetyltransferase [Streptomyces sp. NPDC021093]|uniref:GNAT family N-acetyltransferase n=1 Tax=Streptomyces sp. NPDC021093 TaxID=3365112 RepID=UPI0037B90247
MALAFIELTGFGLRLREWAEDDVAAMLDGINDPEARRWDGMQVGPFDREAALRHIRTRADGWARGDNAQYCITDEHTGEVYGSVGLHKIEPRRGCAGIGYWLRPGARGRGVVTRAVELCTRWGFTELGLHRIELGHATANDASCRVAERAGYVAEGVAREALPAPGPARPFDMHVHARLATDPAPPIG